MAPAVVLMIALVLLGLHASRQAGASTRAAFQAERIEQVGRARVALAAASEAEKSAVLASTDEDSQRYADQARAATAQVEVARRTVEQLLARGGTDPERLLLAQFSQQFVDLQRIDNELLALAVKNTNMKAYGLAFGPAQQAMDEMSAALSQVVAKGAASPDGRIIEVLALGAEATALQIQVLLSPHIAEENDKKMDELEARMAEGARGVRERLDALAALTKLSGDSAVAAATAAYGRFSVLKDQILVLSRANTNVRSLSISLTQKRRMMVLCEESLVALERAIEDERTSDPGRLSPQLPR